MLHGVRCRCGSFGIDDVRWQIKSTCISLHCRCSFRRCVPLPEKKQNIRNSVTFIAPVVVVVFLVKIWSWLHSLWYVLSPRMAHITVKAGRKRAQRHFICSSAPIEYVCFSHQSVLFSVLFNLFTFGPYWRGTVYWFIVPRFLRVPLRAHKAPPPASGLALTLCRPVAGFCFRDRPCRERPCPSITRTSQGKKKRKRKKKATARRPERQQHRGTMWLHLNSRRRGTFASHSVFSFFFLK